MKVAVVGIGQCGGRIADKFQEVGNRIKSFFGRKIEIVVDSFAIDTDIKDLSNLKYIPKDRGHRILMGAFKTSGQGVSGESQTALEIAKKQAPNIVTTILASKNFRLADTVFVISSGAGGTGSGATPKFVEEFKQRLIKKPVYTIVVLPSSDEQLEAPFAITNTATFLTSVYQIADAVILFENDKFFRTDKDVSRNINEANTAIVDNFIDLLSIGVNGESFQKFTAIGREVLPIPAWHSLTRKLVDKKDDFQKEIEHLRIINTLNQAIQELSITCQIEDAGKIYYLISAPKNLVMPDIEAELRDYLNELAPKAEIKGESYCDWRIKDLSITIVVSELSKVEVIEDLYARAKSLGKQQKRLAKEKKGEFEKVRDASKNLPNLLEIPKPKGESV